MRESKELWKQSQKMIFLNTQTSEHNDPASHKKMVARSPVISAAEEADERQQHERPHLATCGDERRGSARQLEATFDRR